MKKRIEKKGSPHLDEVRAGGYEMVSRDHFDQQCRTARPTCKICMKKKTETNLTKPTDKS